jgi:spore coat protein JB
MLLEENRNCGCGCGCHNNSQNYMTSPVKVTEECGCGVEAGTVLAADISSCGCNANEPNRVVDCEARRKMMQEIRCLEFAINDLALYLDTHPDDQKALCLHRKYAKEAKECKDKYQKVFGPLTINYPCNKWRWLEEPWPWERGNF